IYLLIVARVLQAVGGGAFLPVCTGIVSDAFGARRGTAIRLFGSIFPIGGVIGPNLGGVIVDNISWRFIFYVNVPIGVAVIALTSRPFLAANAYTVLFGAGVFGCTAFLPTCAERHCHMSATAAGALLPPRAIVMTATAAVASFLLIRFGYRLPMIAGVALVSL